MITLAADNVMLGMKGSDPQELLLNWVYYLSCELLGSLSGRLQLIVVVGIVTLEAAMVLCGLRRMGSSSMRPEPTER